MVKLQCLKCGTFVFGKGSLRDGVTPPDSQLTCACCPLDHDHAGLGCRPIDVMFVGGVVA
jgi:hypothetical protein